MVKKNRLLSDKRNQIISVVLTLLVLSIYLFPSFATAIDVNITTDKSTYTEADDYVLFNMSVDLGDGEVVPVQNLTLYINDSIFCTFLPDGTFIEGCEGLEINYFNVTESVYTETLYGYGADETGVYSNTNFGYGYGTSWDVDRTGYEGEMMYIFTWNITNITNGNYFAGLEVYAEENGNVFIYDSQIELNFDIDRTSQGNQAPELVNIQNQDATEDILFTYTVTASDADNDVLEYALGTVPSGMTIDNTTGLLEWTPTNAQSLAQNGIYNVTVGTSDGEDVDQLTFQITVAPVNDVPTISGVSDVPNAIEDTPIQLNVSSFINDIDNTNELLIISTDSAYTTINGQNITFNYPNGITSETVSITVSDGELTASDSIVVTIAPVNDAPTTPSIDVTPDSPVDTDDLVCTITTASTDVDNATTYYNYTWYKNNVQNISVKTTSISNTLASANTVNSEDWKCEVFATDNLLTSGTVSDLVQIDHTAPTDLDVVDVTPNVAYTTDLLTCNVNGSNTGGTYVYEWTVNGVLTSFTTSTISAINTSKGQTWSCTAKADDGIAYSAAKSDDVFIQNTKPSNDGYLPRAETATTAEGTDQAFSVTMSDADMDSLSYTWYKDSEIVSTTSSYNFVSTYTSAGDYEITAIVSDGEISVEENWYLSVTDTNRNPTMTAIGTETCTERQTCTIQVNGNDLDSDNTITYYDNSTLFTIDSDTGLISFTSPDTQTVDTDYSVRITVVDDKGGYATQIFTLTVENDNRNPVLNPIGSLTVLENQTYTKTVTSSDPDSDSPLYTDNTSLFTIGLSTGVINFTPGQAEVGTHNVRITVSDGLGGSDYEDIVVVVTNVNNAPTIDSFTPTDLTPSIAEAATQVFSVTTSDLDATTPNVRWLLDGELVSLTSSYSFSKGYLGAGTYTLAVYVDDGNDEVTKTWTITVTDTNRLPVLSAIANQVVSEDSLFTYTLSATDADSDNTLVYSDNSDLFETGLLTGEISFTPTQANVGTHTVIVYVADGTGRVSQTFTINVTNTNDAPVLERIGGLTAIEGQVYTRDLEATDEDLDTLTYSDDTGLFDINSSTGLISFTPTYLESGTYPVRITVSDGNGGSDYEDITLTVLETNVAPNITATSPAENISMKEDNSTTFNVTASDSDGTEVGIAWYLNGVFVEEGNDYLFEGDYSELGSNAGEYNVTVAVSDGLATVTYDWNLTVNRTRDSDEDLLPDYRDNCALIYNPDQTDLDGATPEGLVCEGNEDGDDLLDEEDFVSGTADNVDTNIPELELSINDSDDLNRAINETQPVVLSYKEYDTTTGEATEKELISFNFTFTNETSLDLGNLSLKTQDDNATAGEVIISGIDLSSQNKTKTVYVDDLDSSSNAICIKDQEIASISEVTSDCTGANETLLQCTSSGSSKTSGDREYTCTDLGTTLRVTGLVHSGLVEDSCTASWTCDSWGDCESGEKECSSWTDANSCGTTYSGSDIQVCSSDSSTSTSTYVVPTTKPITSVWTIVEAGDTKTLNIDQEALAVTKTEFTLNVEGENVRIAVELLLEPSHILSGKVFQYVEIAGVNLFESSIESANIEFRVRKTWLTSNGFDTNEVALYRYAGEWVELPTSMLREEANYVYYVAETPGFSEFAIASKGEKTVETPVEDTTPTDETTDDVDNTPTDVDTGDVAADTDSDDKVLVDDETDDKKSSNAWIWIVLIVLVILFLLHKKHKGHKATKHKKTMHHRVTSKSHAHHKK